MISISISCNHVPISTKRRSKTRRRPQGSPRRRRAGHRKSSRLDDPRGYTLKRDVSDLAAIREEIEAERVVLIGHSYGGTIAAAYYPERVAKMALS